MGELLTLLRQALELDREAGIEFVIRPAAPAAETADAGASASVAASALSLRRAAARSGDADPPPARPPAALPARTGLPAADLAAIAAAVSVCQACRLCEQRTRTVPGEGSPAAELVFVGEGPGADEDATGRPFVGAAGQLLDRMIAAMGLRREEVYICNAVKCRPPGNRVPQDDELAACRPYLEAQLAIIRPRVICLLGATPLKSLLGLSGVGKVRGQRLEWQGIPVIPTYHPAYLLRNPAAKKPAWEDLKAVLAVLGRQPPPRGAG